MHPGAACLVHSYARSVVAERTSNGWGEYGSSRAYDSAKSAKTEVVRQLDVQLAGASKAVWRALLLKARFHSAVRAVPAVVVVVLMALVVSVPVVFAVALGCAIVARRVLRSPALALPDPRVDLAVVLAGLPIKRSLRKHAMSMPASALSDPALRDLIRPLLESLEGKQRQLAWALQPGFPGSIGELVAISHNLSS